MNQKDEKASYHMKIGKAEITATAYLENPQVICSYQGLFELDKLQNENKKLREALIECPIVGEIHRDSNDRFKEWNLIHRNTIREALKEVESK